MTLKQKLDAFALSRTQHDLVNQVILANDLIDTEIPLLIERLAEVILEREEARHPKFIAKGTNEDLLGCHL